MGLGKTAGLHLSAHGDMSWSRMGCGKRSDCDGVGDSPLCVPSVPLMFPLLGIWSNLYAANLQDSLYWASDPSQFWDRWAQDQANLGRCLGSL